MKNYNISEDFEQLSSQKIRNITGFSSEECGGIVHISFIMDSHALDISVDNDYDELHTRVNSCNNSINKEYCERVDLLEKYIGREMGWLWSGKNYLGYNDVILLSFDGIEPNLCFIGMAATILILELNAIR
jgi:tetrahydromethanopterin S-methyltransferase subunit G